MLWVGSRGVLWVGSGGVLWVGSGVCCGWVVGGVWVG